MREPRRPLTKPEPRLDLAEMHAALDDRPLAQELSRMAVEIAGDLRRKAGVRRLNAQTVSTLKPSPAIGVKYRRRIEKALKNAWPRARAAKGGSPNVAICPRTPPQ